MLSESLFYQDSRKAFLDKIHKTEGSAAVIFLPKKKKRRKESKISSFLGIKMLFFD